MSESCLIIGLSALGTRLARGLAARGVNVCVADRDKVRLDAIKAKVAEAARIDATNAAALKELKPLKRTHVVVAIDHDFLTAQLACLHLRELGVEKDRLTAVANTGERAEILAKIGVGDIVTPGLIQAESLARELADPKTRMFRPVAGKQGVCELKLSRDLFIDGQTVEKARSEGFALMGWRADSDGPFEVDWGDGRELSKGDRVLVFGPEDRLDGLVKGLAKVGRER